MNKRNKAEFVTMIIDALSKKQGFSRQQAYRYLHNFKGIEFLDQHYEIIHTLDFKEALDSLLLYCRRQGGAVE